MNLSPVQLHENVMLQTFNSLKQWGYPDSEGYSSLSPASSTDSYEFSPPYQHCVFSQETYSGFQGVVPQTEVLTENPSCRTARKSQRNRMIYNQRQSASEREKMRMRNLSTALQHLRRYLPPAVAPLGKNLTKIETLRMTIRYIAHLSEVLGLDEETMIKRREEEIRRSNLCSVGLHGYQDRVPEVSSSQATMHLPETPTPCQFYNSSRTFPEQSSFGITDRNLHLAPQHTPEVPAPDTGEEMNIFYPYTSNTSPAHETAMPDTKEAFTSASQVSPDLGFCQNIIDDLWDELKEKDLWTSFQPPEVVHPQGFC